MWCLFCTEDVSSCLSSKTCQNFLKHEKKVLKHPMKRKLMSSCSTQEMSEIYFRSQIDKRDVTGSAS